MARSYYSGKFFYCLLLISFFLIGSTETRSEETITVSRAWIRAAPGGATVLAGYFRITNSGQKAEELLSVSSPRFKHIMVHQSVVRGGVAEMKHVDSFIIKPGQTRNLQPGGYHLMLMHPKTDVKPGQSIPLNFKFESGKTLSKIFNVKRQQ
jgi:copper(I)-binding protein